VSVRDLGGGCPAQLVGVWWLVGAYNGYYTHRFTVVSSWGVVAVGGGRVGGCGVWGVGRGGVGGGGVEV